MTTERDNTLRNFLKAGAGLAVGAAIIYKGGRWTTILDEGLHKSSSETGETVKLLSPDGEVIEVDKGYLTAAAPERHAKSVRDRVGLENRKFVMVIDLGRCKNARKCITSCQKMHHLPEEKELIKVLAMKDREDSAPYWFPKTCFHCDNPPCVKVCPTDATYKRQDGLVLIDNNRCIGCKFCMAACPYSTRVFNWFENESEDIPLTACGHPTHPDASQPEATVPHQVGTVMKCDFCPDMARIGKLPDCVTACPNGVIYFGDENEDVVSNGSETVRLSTLLKDKSGYRYMEELGTEPRVYYLPPVNRQFPFERGLDDQPEDLLRSYDEVLNPHND